eukprot:gene26601-32667_t
MHELGFPTSTRAGSEEVKDGGASGLQEAYGEADNLTVSEQAEEWQSSLYSAMGRGDTYGSASGRASAAWPSDQYPDALRRFDQYAGVLRPSGQHTQVPLSSHESDPGIQDGLREGRDRAGTEILSRPSASRHRARDAVAETLSNVQQGNLVMATGDHTDDRMASGVTEIHRRFNNPSSSLQLLATVSRKEVCDGRADGRQQAALRTLTMSKETREQGTSPIPQLRQAEEPAERLIKLTPHLTPESRTPKPELTPMEVFPAPSPALDLRSVEVFKAELDTVRRQVVGMGVELEAARAEAAQARRAEKTALAAVAGAPAEAWAMASQVEGARREAAEARQAEAGAWQKEARAQLAAEARARELTHEMEALRGALEEARHGEAMAQEEVKALYDVHRGLEVTRAELENTQMAEAHLREEVESLQGCREELERVRVVAANRESAAQAGSDVVRELADELNKARVEVAEVRAEEVTTRAAAEAARVEVGQAWAEAETAKVHTVKEAKQVVAEAVMRAEAQVKEAARGKRAAEKAAAAAREEVAQVAGAARAEVQEARAEQRVSLQASEAAQATLASEFQSARAQTAKLRAELEGEAHAERLRMEAELERAKANAEHWKTEIETEIVREGHHVETELARVRAEHGLAQEAVTIQLLHVQDRANSLLVELEGSRVQLVLREEELSESQRERVSQAAQANSARLALEAANDRMAGLGRACARARTQVSLAVDVVLEMERGRLALAVLRGCWAVWRQEASAAGKLAAHLAAPGSGWRRRLRATMLAWRLGVQMVADQANALASGTESTGGLPRAVVPPRFSEAAPPA